MKTRGFTLIELVVVIVILGIIAVTALPRFLNIQTDARISTIRSMQSSMQYANEQVHAKALLGYVKVRDPSSSSTRLTFLDLNKDGIQQEHQGEWDLIYNYIDNTHIDDAIIIDGSFSTQEEGSANLYVGYDKSSSGDVKSGNCWVLYTQATAGNNELPEYQRETSGC
ncbi:MULTISPECIES: prepilin-type N-terminal cleavage/methylation domain-containing protein [Vibrio]|uniref:Prepilin-type N-terminal cleavage/methylation domain-containing protein n=1 Tax=Vibrio cortegadensis TaxID=1328770 RepID=A0ABV4M389_9VIBR|nr:prepilin-type N-terminal cleavage/methylation domain-containing protein [Vibrio sp. 03-59-1]NOH82431.1 prepilin-type N-terminal cleavage/methylation domain-containing protein [Vibrio sp. 03-59-1]RBW64792.1 hypothetical protein DS893_14035 [Vibrionales bacterium C3R12]